MSEPQPEPRAQRPVAGPGLDESSPELDLISDPRSARPGVSVAPTQAVGTGEPTIRRIVRLAVGRPTSWQEAEHRFPAIVAVVFRLVSVGLVATIGGIHLHLWLQGYRTIPTIGPLFLLNSLGALVLGAALLLWPRILTGVLALGFVASSLGALLLSINGGLFGFQEFTSVALVVPTIVIECVAIGTLVVWLALVAVTSGPMLWRGR